MKDFYIEIEGNISVFTGNLKEAQAASEGIVQECHNEVGTPVIREGTINFVQDNPQLESNYIAQSYLNNTDWKVMRHIREKALGRTTTLTEDEYLALESEREHQADLIVEIK